MTTIDIELEEKKRDSMEVVYNYFCADNNPPGLDILPDLKTLIGYYNMRINHIREGKPLLNDYGGLIPVMILFNNMQRALAWVLSLDDPEKPTLRIQMIGEVLWDLCLEMDRLISCKNAQLKVEDI